MNLSFDAFFVCSCMLDVKSSTITRYLGEAHPAIDPPGSGGMPTNREVQLNFLSSKKANKTFWVPVKVQSKIHCAPILRSGNSKYETSNRKKGSSELAGSLRWGEGSFVVSKSGMTKSKFNLLLGFKSLDAHKGRHVWNCIFCICMCIFPSFFDLVCIAWGACIAEAL